jgi:hypothetical protein
MSMQREIGTSFRIGSCPMHPIWMRIRGSEKKKKRAVGEV